MTIEDRGPHSQSGTSIIGLLGVAFVVLKLCKVIDWSWWYVTLPFWFWIPMILTLLLLAFIWDVVGKK